MEDQLTILYNNLKEQGFRVPENEQEFRTLMADKDQAYRVHQGLIKNDFKVPAEFHDFYAILNPLKKKASTPPSGVPGPPYPESSFDPSAQPETGSSVSGDQLTPQAPVIPEPKFDDQADREKALSNLDAQLAQQQARMQNPVLDKVAKQWTSPSEKVAMQFQPQIDAQIAAEKEHSIRQIAEVDPKDLEKNPFVTMGKSAWNTLAYQLPSAMVAAVAAGAKPNMDRPSAEAMFPDFSKQAGTPGNRTTEQITKENKANMLEWAAKHGMKGEKLTDNLVSTLDKIKDPIDALNWMSYALGQAAGQIPASVVSGGATSMGQEIGSIYMDGIKKIAQEKNISIDEVIKRDLDKPAFAIAYGTTAGLLDYLSAKNITSVGKESLLKSLRNRAANILLTTTTEAGTEYAQTWMEQIGKGQVAGDSLGKSWEEANTHPAAMERLESAAQGAVGGVGAHIGAHLATHIVPENIIKAPEGDLGNPPKANAPQSEPARPGPVRETTPQAEKAKEETRAPDKGKTEVTAEVGKGNEKAPEGVAVKEKIKPLPIMEEVDQDVIDRHLEPVADKMAEIENHFQNKGYDIADDYDNETAVTKNGEFVPPEELPEDLKKLAGDYETAVSKLGEATNVGKLLGEARKRFKGTEVPAEVVESKTDQPKEHFGKDKKFEVLGINEEGHKVGVDKNGVRGVLQGKVIVTQPVGMVPTRAGYEAQVSSPEGEFLTTEETKLKQQEHALRESGSSSLLQHPQEGVGEKGSGRERVESSQQGNEPATPQQEEEVPRKVGSDTKEKVKGVTERRLEDDGKTLLYGSKTNKKRISVKGLSRTNIKEEIDFEKQGLARLKNEIDSFDENKVREAKGLTDLEKIAALKQHKQSITTVDEIEKIVIPFLEGHLAQPQASDTKEEEITQRLIEKGIPAAPGNATAKVLVKALTDRKAALGLLHTGNKNSREIWSEETGVKLPKTEGGTQKAINEYFDKQEENGTENNTNVPVTNGENAPELAGGEPTTGIGETVSPERTEGLPEPDRGASGGEPGETNASGENGGRSIGSGDINNPESGAESNNETPSEGVGEGNRVLTESELNHRIGPDDEIVPKGEVAKIRGNIEAIKLAKQLVKEDRNATPYEKEVLARFVGWGGLAPVLDENKAHDPWADAWKSKYEKFYKEIKSLLSPEEFQTAVNSTINAHYTDRKVISSLWDLAQRLGFKGGNVLEPSAGVGHFFGLMPERMANKSTLRGYELDKLTGQILSKLYPQASIRVTGYENSVEANNSQDLVISNVPFGQTAPFDKKNPDLSKFNLHNYFIGKGIRQLKPGGLGIFITSSSTLDNPGTSVKFREWTTMEGNADFIGAIRLPNNAFSENAGTQVTTDILVYKKRTEDNASEYNQPYRNVVPISETENSEGHPVTIDVNEYYATHPEMMLGTMKLAHEAGSGGLYNADSQTLVASKDQDTATKLSEAIAKLPADIFGAKAQPQQKVEAAGTTEKEGTLVTKGDKLYLIENGERVAQKNEQVNGNNGKKYPMTEVVKDYTDVKESIRTLLKAEQSDTATDEDIDAMRKKLNDAYDKFNKKYGTFNRNQRVKFLEDDTEHTMAFALEDIKKQAIIQDDGKVSRKYTIDKAPIFNKRVNFPVKEPVKAENVGDALNISISYRNKIDVPYISSMTGLTEEEARQNMLDTGLAYENPVSGLLEDADSYLSGFVRTKLRQAEDAGEGFESNVKALKEVVPKDIPAQMIEFKLGTPWIPGQFIESWLKEQLGVAARIRYNKAAGMWTTNLSFGGDQRNRITYAAGDDFTAFQLVEKALNLRQPEVSDTIRNPDGSKSQVKNAAKTAQAQGKMQELMDMFYNYVKENKEFQEQIERIYNDTYNDFIEKKYSLPSFTHFPGANKDVTLRIHQRKAVARMLHDSVLLAHQVGTGKTFTMITAAMEMRRLGIANKPMIVVQNATLEQFANSFKKLYPGANILAPTKKDMDAKNRQLLFNKIAYGDWDSIIIPQSFLDFIPDNEDRERGYLNEQLDELKSALLEAGNDRGAANELRRTIKELEKRMDEVGQKKPKKVKDIARENLAVEKAFQKQANRKSDDVFEFEQMGIDALMLDEAHAFKKLGFLSKMPRIKGIDIGRSKRALGAFLKARWIQEKNKNRNVILATGTPITNTMAEVWTMMRFVAPDILDRYNINTFDEFASTFGSVDPSLEFTASGKFKIVERFKSYINAPELLTAFRSKTDVVLTEDIPEFKEEATIPKLKVQPDGKEGFTQVILKQTAGLEQAMASFKSILEKWEKLTGKEKRAQSYIPLLIFNKAKQAAIDLRLINPSERDDIGSKTNRVTKEIKRIYDETSPYNGTQLVFSDMYQSPEQKEEFLDEEGLIPNPSFGKPRFNLYQDMLGKLKLAGIPADQMAIVNEYEGEKREALFDKVKAGQVRILFGSTEKMGVGVNVQDRLAALHHMDAPPRPMDFEQRNGRILRQGNLHAEMNKPVEVLTYGVEKTLDATAYQRLAFKQKFINQMMKAEGVDRVMADEADEDAATDMTFDQMMSTLSGSQYAILHTQKMYELRKLKTAKTNHDRNVIDMSSQIRKNESLIKALHATEKEYKPLQAEFKKVFPDLKVTKVTVEGKEYSEKMGDAIQKYLDKKFHEVNTVANAPSIKGLIQINGLQVELKINKHFSIAKNTTTNSVDYTIFGKEATHGISGAGNVQTGQGLVVSMNSAINNFVEEGDNGHTNINEIPKKIDRYTKDNEALEKIVSKPFDKEDKLAKIQKDVADLEEKMKAENQEAEKPVDLDAAITDISQRSGDTFENFNAAMSSIFPMKPSKVKKQTSNKALLAHVNKKNMTEAELQAQLEEDIKLRPTVEERFKGAAEPVKPNVVSGVVQNAKDFLSGFKSHFRYLPEKQFPREANILREFEGLKPYAHKQAEIYIKGIVEPLTKQQYDILARRIILEDMLSSIDQGLEMTGLDGKLPFGFEDRIEVEDALKKYVDFTNADPELKKAYDTRQDFMRMFKQALIDSGLLTDNDIKSYYHRRVLAYQSDQVGQNILFGKQIGDKTRDFQKKRRGTKGMDYSTNFNETEYKVVAEGLYELEKQKILKDLMTPYEQQLKEIKGVFNTDFKKKIFDLEQQFGENSPEAEVYKSAKNTLMRNHLLENIPEGYTFYRVSDENRLFWAKTVTQQVIDRSLAKAQELDDSGNASSVDAVDYLVNELGRGLMVGAKRHAYMVPEQLANELEELAKNKDLTPAQNLFQSIVGEWKKIVLMAPNRLLKYNLNNFASDVDRTFQAEPAIRKYAKESMDDLWDFMQTGKVTPELNEAMRGSVIDSGFEISELNSLSKQQWSSYFLDRKDGPSIDDIFGKKWTTEMMKTVVSSPRELYKKYIDFVAKYTRFRENVLRYAAYILAVEKIKKGEEFYWASSKSAIDAIPDKRQRAAKLARDVYGDYGNISYSGQQLRRFMLPFYSWLEINMGTHVQLIKNAFSPEVHGGLKKGVTVLTFKMLRAQAAIFAFTAMVETWNRLGFPLLLGDDDDDWDAAEKLRRTHSRGMQIIISVDDQGVVHTIPVVGAFYDFVDFFGIWNAADDIAHIFTGNDPLQSGIKTAENIAEQTSGHVFNMVTPAIKMPIEAKTGLKFFPDPQNPIPIRDYKEWFADAITLKDEYNYLLTDKPQKDTYLERKMKNSLIMRELDPEMLAYYQAKHIVADYTGHKASIDTAPENPQEVAKSKALLYFTMALRQGDQVKADEYLRQYAENGGTRRALVSKIKGEGDPFAGLKTKPNNTENISEKEDLMNAVDLEDYKPQTKFVQGLTRDQILVFKDAKRYQDRLLNLNLRKK